jgi:hypothetical protein
MNAPDVTRKPPTPDALAAASARLSKLIKKGGRSYMAELQRHAAEPEQDNRAAPDESKTPAHDASPPASGDFADVIRLRGAMGVALALLDELLVQTPAQPDSTDAMEVAEIFKEMAEIAADGVSAARRAAGKEKD